MSTHIKIVQNSMELVMLQSKANSPVKLQILLSELTASSLKFPSHDIYGTLYITLSLSFTSLSSLKTGDISYSLLVLYTSSTDE